LSDIRTLSNEDDCERLLSNHQTIAVDWPFFKIKKESGPAVLKSSSFAVSIPSSPS
jgi:hypothetical protein